MDIRDSLKTAFPSVQPQEVVQLSIFGGTTSGLFTYQQVIDALRKCLRGKSNTMEAQMFVNAFYAECYKLCCDLNSRTYAPSRYIAFIKPQPVIREVFASKFRDRGVDTLIIQRVLPLLEEHFVVDNYSTRVGKGTLFGVHRISQMIYEVSEGYTRDCWILQLDIWSFFMSLSKKIACQLWADFLNRYYHAPDRELIIHTISTILNDRPELHCIRKGLFSDWNPLPRHKSLFYGDGAHGLPIGKVLVQMTALLYLNDLDILLITEWGVPHNGHYMDDRSCVHRSSEHLLAVKEKIDNWHQSRELLTHPNKTKLIDYRQGVKFAGAMILPGRTYLLNSTISKCYRKLHYFNRMAIEEPGFIVEHLDEFISTMNSYFGMLYQHAEYNTTHRIIRSIADEWFGVMSIERRRGCRRNYVVRPLYRYSQTAKACEMLGQRMKHYGIKVNKKYKIRLKEVYYDNRRSMCPAA